MKSCACERSGTLGVTMQPEKANDNTNELASRYHMLACWQSGPLDELKPGTSLLACDSQVDGVKANTHCFSSATHNRHKHTTVRNYAVLDVQLTVTAYVCNTKP